MAQSILNINRNFDPTVSFLREGCRLTYTFSAVSTVPGVIGMPFTMTFWRDKQIKSLVTNVLSTNITNVQGMSNNMVASFDPALGVTVTGLGGVPITFTPLAGVAKFDLVLVVEHGNNAGVVGPAFQNNTHYDITMSNPETSQFLTSGGNQWTCYSSGRPGPRPTR
jgi:hypothetical protein